MITYRLQPLHSCFALRLRLCCQLYKHRPNLTLYRRKATESQRENTDSRLVKRKETGEVQLSLGEKVKQTSKDATWIVVIVGGLGVTGFMFYTIFSELFSGDSANGVYTRAFDKCKKDPRITDVLGTPIKGYGELSSRGRRRHVLHSEFVDQHGVEHMRMRFYIQGPHRKANVHVEMKKNEKRHYDFHYLIVDLEGYPYKTITLEDYRSLDLQST